jgi:hypothetical protein
MQCPVCNITISNKRKKQIKHLRIHSADELISGLLWLRYLIDEREKQERQEHEETVSQYDPGVVPSPAFSLVEEDREEDSDQAMSNAGMVQCAHCGLWLWPGDMPYHLESDCPEVSNDLNGYMERFYKRAEISDPPAAPPVEQADPGAVLPGDFDNIGDPARCGYCNAVITPENYNTHGYDCPLALPVDDPNRPPAPGIKAIRIAVDGPESVLLNTLTRFTHHIREYYSESNGPSFLDTVYFRANAGTEYHLPADGVECEVLNALAAYVWRSINP